MKAIYYNLFKMVPVLLLFFPVFLLSGSNSDLLTESSDSYYTSTTDVDSTNNYIFFNSKTPAQMSFKGDQLKIVADSAIDFPVFDNSHGINIDGDSNFTLTASVNNWPGNGSEANPFVLKDLSTTAISIQNTDSYFVVDNLTTTGVNANFTEYFSYPFFINVSISVFFSNVEHGKVIYSSLKDVLIYKSNYINISDNIGSQFDQPKTGDVLFKRNCILYFNNVSDSLISHNFNFTIQFNESMNNEILYNSFVNGTIQLLSGSDYNNISFNNINYYQDWFNTGWPQADSWTRILFVADSNFNNIANNTIIGENLGLTTPLVCTNSNNTRIEKNLLVTPVHDLEEGQRAALLISGKDLIIESNTIYGSTYFAGTRLKISNNTVLDGSGGINFGGAIDIFWPGGGFGANDSTISNNIIKNSGVGMSIGGNNNTIFSNIIENSGAGILLGPFLGSSYNNLFNNTIRNNKNFGILLKGANFNTLQNNTFLNNGIDSEFTGCCVLPHNPLYENGGFGIMVGDASQFNRIYNNSFVGNRYKNLLGRSQIYDLGTGNTYELNYFDDWTSPDSNGDGIVDNPYPIAGNENQFDYHPLLTPFSHFQHEILGLKVLFPNGNENLNGSITIIWSPIIDTFNHKVTFSVYLSNDSQSWILLRSDLTTNYYVWDSAEFLLGINYMIKVVAVCEHGLSIMDVSDNSFRLLNSPTYITDSKTDLTSSLSFNTEIFLSILILMPILRRLKKKKH